MSLSTNQLQETANTVLEALEADPKAQVRIKSTGWCVSISRKDTKKLFLTKKGVHQEIARIDLIRYC